MKYTPEILVKQRIANKTMTTPTENIEKLAEQIHIWYLEATRELKPESYNLKAVLPYAKLTDEQKYMDRFLAKKMIERESASYAKGVEDSLEVVRGIEKDLKFCAKQSVVQEDENLVRIFNSQLNGIKDILQALTTLKTQNQ